MIIRGALLADAAAMAALRAASIEHLCRLDHHDDAVAIHAWVGDSDKFERLLALPGVILVVAEIDRIIAGLGGLYGDRITLNYVHPIYRFRGVSKAVMAALEQRLIDSGVTLGRLDSTATAVRFYRSIGWMEAGAADAEKGQPMIKRL